MTSGGGPRRIAIVGGGPSGSALATLLSHAGRAVVVFDAGARPDLIVGESLLPAVIPMLRELGVEDEVRSFGLFKPGATVGFGEGDEYSFDFEQADGELPGYAYNVPRDLFDAALLAAAERAGATVIRDRARVRRRTQGGLELDSEAAARAGEALGGQPDLLVDATGRARAFTRALHLSEVRGRRRDTALFAHYDRAELLRPGDIHVDRLARGWSWRIPLRGRVSVGVVVAPEHLRPRASREEQLDRFVHEEPRLRTFLAQATRISAVMRYSNYQLVTTRLHGQGWALAGDAAGFVDPIFSTGLYLAMKGAMDLGRALLAGASLGEWERRWLVEVGVWRLIIQHWYDGRLFALFRVGRRMRRAPPGGLIDAHVTRHLTRIFTGEAGVGSYARGLLSVLVPLGRASAGRLRIR